MNEEDRGTGKSTGLILVALGNASLAHGREVEFADHCPHKHCTAQLWKNVIQNHAYCLGLEMKVRREGKRVFVRSTIDTTKRESK